MTFSELVIAYRTEHNMSQRQFARRCNVSNGYISMLEKGVNPKTQQPLIPTLPSIQKIAAGMNMTVNELFSQIDEMPISMDDRDSSQIPPQFSTLPKMKQWRVLGATACGTPLHQETPWETVEAPEDISADVVFRCVGDSMINARIFDGDLVFVRLKPEVENGQIAVVRIEEEYTLKRLYISPDYVELRAENPTMPAIILRGKELEDFEIVGEAVTFLSAVR